MMMRIEELREARDPNSRHFVDLPEVVFFDQLADHIGELPGAEIREFEADGVIAVWIEFGYRGHTFFVDNALGDYRFWVEDPKCEESILLDLAAHLRRLLEKDQTGFADEIQEL